MDGGPNLIVDFDSAVRSYDVSTSGSMVTVRADALINSSTVNWVWRVGGEVIGGDAIGVDGGEVTFPFSIPPGQSELGIAVRAGEGTGTATALYNINIDRVPSKKVFTLACTSSYYYEIFPIGEEVTYLEAELTVEPTDAIYSQGVFNANLSGTIPLSETLLDLAQLLPGGVEKAAFQSASITVLVRSGATGIAGGQPQVVRLDMVPLPTTCAHRVDAQGYPVMCDPADDMPVPGEGIINSKCGPNDFCGQIADVPVERTLADCAMLDALKMQTPPSTEKTTQFNNNGFCIAGDYIIPLAGETGEYRAASSGEVLFGLDDQYTGAILVGAEYILPEATSDPDDDLDNGLLAGIIGAPSNTPFSIGMKCTMAVPAVETFPGSGVFLPGPTPDPDLISFDIGPDLCIGVTCADDSNECTNDACDPPYGRCPYTPEADGTPCTLPGGGGESCQSGVCVDVGSGP